MEDEEIIEGVFRQDFTYFLSEAFIAGLLWFGWSWVVFFFYPKHLLVLWLALLLGGAIHVFAIFLWWYYNAILMTNMNIIIVKWHKPLVKSITRIDYWNLDEIVVEKKGWGAFMYNYGNLIFQKLSDGEPISYKNVKNPTKIATIIDDYKEKVVHERNFSSDQGIKDLLVDALGRHIDQNGVSAPPSLQNKMSRVDKRGIAVQKPKEVTYYRSHWTDFVPWSKKSVPKEVFVEKTAESEENVVQKGENETFYEEYGTHVVEKNTINSPLVTYKGANAHGHVEIHHHHHYETKNAHFEAQKPYAPQNPDEISVVSAYNEKEEVFPKKIAQKNIPGGFVAKNIDDEGGIALEFDE